MAGTVDGIAADLRAKIQSGELRPGDRLPSMEELTREYDVAGVTVRLAVNRLKAEGLVEHRGGRGGNRVRERPASRMVRSRSMDRDELGYFSGTAQNWRTVQGTRTEIGTKPAPADIAEGLGVPAGTPVLVRERLIGDPEQPKHRQMVHSYYPPDLVAELPILAGDTGLGGSYDRIEEWAGKPIQWCEEVTAVTPSPDEAKTLLLPAGVPILRLLRRSSIGSGKKARVVELQRICMSAELFAVRYPLERRGAARWPVRPATGDFYNS